jgi:hypothetical protein
MAHILIAPLDGSKDEDPTFPAIVRGREIK